MIPDLQLARDTGADLVDLDPAGAMDVELYWQQWRVAGPTLERVGRAVQATAAQFLR
jgi:LysR family transcriptional regulator (chromosome initiation inhibitor)